MAKQASAQYLSQNLLPTKKVRYFAPEYCYSDCFQPEKAPSKRGLPGRGVRQVSFGGVPTGVLSCAPKVGYCFRFFLKLRRLYVL
ncbi:MAG: hypothetical protein D6714_13460 [Bacteroidetes bacterium]|nr:MAG: hypothetical protein D6714_13460 [Bacteroidota bacterium]